MTSHASVCNITMVRFESGTTAERGCGTAALCTATLVLHRWYGAVLDITLASSSTQCVPIELVTMACSPDLSPIENMWSVVWQRLTPDYTPSCHRSTLATCEAFFGLLYPRTHPKSL
ncbi:hypothetical protein TNCV_2991191 [Trichonephila clavipes]|nr:hypothetical protein TNCV_2991191 [Trichonephila clavipes]